MLSEDALSRVILRVPQKEGKALAMLEAKSRIYSRNYKDGLVELEAEAPESVLRKLRGWVVEESKPVDVVRGASSDNMKRASR
jgi:hypothetical protein